MTAETIRYDQEEDRANDVKRHDNPRHPSGHNNDVKKEEAVTQQGEQA